ncbi:MAG: Hsp33 family molecular chaperone HslO [Hyphomonadaceae bacterium]|nr:MAG: molecular chaperone Hsp33 [Caulobacteraceae bacterium]MBT9444585.1 Hsp33 family molecular chaperone HslO [Hyphomonadaceae bacterium]TPW03593.1 MAG: molecular chaperone Hsp33 [Alphaproteobacteria bacterium]
MVSRALSATDDTVAAFTIDGAPVRGRYARLGVGTIDPIIKRHAYPRPVALLLGETLTLAALVGSLLKDGGTLTVQAEGDGPAPLLVAEYRAGGGLRGYARVTDPDLGNTRRTPADLIGAGALTLTLDQGPDTEQMQGVVPLEGDTLAQCAELYFDRSEQTPTRVLLAVGEEVTAHGSHWRAGGGLIQRVAGDATRGFTEEDWNRAQILFESLTDAEMLDPTLATEVALFRLFHEDGVRMAHPRALADRCTCDRERLAALLKRFTAEELADLVEPDGKLHARCQFCARLYLIDPAQVSPHA